MATHSFGYCPLTDQQISADLRVTGQPCRLCGVDASQGAPALSRRRDGVPTGRERSKVFDRKIDVERYLIDVEARKQRGEWIDPDLGATRLSDWAGEWLATRSHLKPKTLEGYESLLRTWVLPTFGSARLDRIEPNAVDMWIAEMRESGLSASRIRQVHQVLRAILNSAVRNRYLASNPAVGASLPRTRHREMLFLNAEQLDDLAQAIPEPYATLIYLLGYGGLRWGEAAARTDNRRTRQHPLDVRASAR